MTTLQTFFNNWKMAVSFKKYDEWCALPETQEMLNEIKKEEQPFDNQVTFY